MSFHATVLTLYPEMFPGPLGASLAGEGLKNGLWSLDARNIRDFGHGRHRAVDDTPAGGGPGMVVRADVLASAIDSATQDFAQALAGKPGATFPEPAPDPRPRLLMSPRGKPFTQTYARELAAGPGALIVCGRFEGVDQRVIEARGLTEVSIGDYILSGGEMAALTMLDAIVRLIPGVMGELESGTDESFENGLLEYPHYTRPQLFEGRGIPEVLTSGNHKKIAEWRKQQSIEITRARRPDLLEKKR